VANSRSENTTLSIIQLTNTPVPGEKQREETGDDVISSGGNREEGIKSSLASKGKMSKLRASGLQAYSQLRICIKNKSGIKRR